MNLHKRINEINFIYGIDEDQCQNYRAYSIFELEPLFFWVNLDQWEMHRFGGLFIGRMKDAEMFPQIDEKFLEIYEEEIKKDFPDKNINVATNIWVLDEIQRRLNI
jgi:hypothetical protein